MTLRDEIDNILYDEIEEARSSEITKARNKILVLIEDSKLCNHCKFKQHGTERCEWTLVGNEMGRDFHKTSCGHTPSVWYPQKMAPYCPFCGRKIEVFNVTR